MRNYQFNPKYNSSFFVLHQLDLKKKKLRVFYAFIFFFSFALLFFFYIFLMVMCCCLLLLLLILPFSFTFFLLLISFFFLYFSSYSLCSFSCLLRSLFCSFFMKKKITIVFDGELEEGARIRTKEKIEEKICSCV